VRVAAHAAWLDLGFRPTTLHRMDRYSLILMHLAAVAAMVRGLAAFDGGGSAASNHPTASAILFVGGLFALISLRQLPKMDAR
jgi:hypothetical protein